MLNVSSRDITDLLHQWADGSTSARDAVVALVYGELKRRAAVHLRAESRGALNPTELVHEAYLRLVDQRRTAWQNRQHFFAIASQMMRRILVDRARARQTTKRSGQWARMTLDERVSMGEPAAVDLLDLDAALTRLAAMDARKCHLAELRFFAGLSIAEAAQTLGVSEATAERDWQAARAWLLKELSPA
jgi:RNA polymerase sigma factor (TIGR02999 family)